MKPELHAPPPSALRCGAAALVFAGLASLWMSACSSQNDSLDPESATANDSAELDAVTGAAKLESLAEGYLAAVGEHLDGEADDARAAGDAVIAERSGELETAAAAVAGANEADAPALEDALVAIAQGTQATLQPLSRDDPDGADKIARQVELHFLEPLGAGLPESADHAVEAKAPGPREHLRGTLEHDPQALDEKTVEAYKGDEFFLADADERLTLQPSERVSSEQLEELDGAKVKVVAVKVEGERPEPDERAAVPVDDDGQPVPRGAGYKVLEIEVVP